MFNAVLNIVILLSWFVAFSLVNMYICGVKTENNIIFNILFNYTK